MSLITLENSRLRALIDPDQGAGLLSFAAKKDGVWLPLTPDARRPDCDLTFASFLMVPYSNRVDNGAFTFRGRSYQLERGSEHAIHGDVRTRPWEVRQRTQTRLCCSFDSAAHDRVNWPWPFAVWAEFELRDRTFAARLTLWNRGHTAMPAGFGWHPYFNRALTTPGEPVHLCFQVRGAYPDADGSRIPSGPPQPPASNQDFSIEKSLDPDNFLDTCFQGYDGGGQISWPQSGVRLRFECSSGCTHLILYNPAGKPYFAVEPVTNANNGVNLLARSAYDGGIVVLEADASLEACFALHVDTE